MLMTKSGLLKWFGLLSVLLSMTAVAGVRDQLVVTDGETLTNPQDVQVLSTTRTTALAFSHDGSLIGTGSADGRICLWRVNTGYPDRCFGQAAGSGKTRPVTALAFDPQDQWLATGGTDGQVQFWRTHRGKAEPPCTVGALPEYPALGRGTIALAFTSVGGELLTAGGRNGTSRVCTGFGPATSKDKILAATPLPPLAGLPGSLFDRAAVDGKGELIVVAKDDRLGAWRLRTGEQLWFVPQVGSQVGALALDASASVLATGHIDGSIRLWHPHKGQERRLPTHHKQAVQAIALSKDGSRLAAGSEDGVVSIWDLRSFAHQIDLVNQDSHEPIEFLQFAPDGRLAVASGEDGITLWDVSSGRVIRTLGSYVHRIRSVAFAPSSKGEQTLLATASEDGMVRLWKRVSAVTDAKFQEPSWSLACVLPGVQGRAVALAFQPPDGQQLAAVGDGRMVQIWNTADCSPSRSLEGEQDGGWLRSVAFGPDGQQLVAGSQRGSILQWRMSDETWKSERSLDVHSDEVGALAFAPPTGTLLISGSMNGSVLISDVRTGQKVGTLPPQAAGISALSVDPQSQRFALAAGREVSLWELSTQKSLGTLKQQQSVKAVQFAPTGERIATISESGRLQIWDVASRELVSSIETKQLGDLPGRWQLAWSPDGKNIATAALGRIDLWNVADGMFTARLWQGPKNDWAVLEPGKPAGKLFRHETGGLLWERFPGGGLGLLRPPPPVASPNFQVRLDFEPNSPSASPDSLGTVTALITNSSAGPVYWLHAEPVDVPEGLDLRPVESEAAPTKRLRLDPGETATFHLSLVDKKHRWLPPRSVRFCIAARHAWYEETGLVCSQHPSGSIAQISLSLGPWVWRNLLSLLAVTGLSMILIGAGLLRRSYRRARSHPLTVRIQQGQNPLRELVLSEIPSAAAALRRACWSPTFRARMEQAFQQANIDEHGWRRTVRAARSATDCAATLAESLAVQTAVVPTQRYRNADLVVFSLALPPLAIRLSHQVPLIVVTTQKMTPQQAVAGRSLAELGHPDLVLLVDLTGTRQTRDEIRQALEDSHPRATFVVISEAELTLILLSRDSQKARGMFRRLIVAQCDRRILLPYENGGSGIPAEQSGHFFGRKAELEKLLQFRHRNFLLVGPRSMGKSSLLNALSRQLKLHHPDSRVVLAPLFDDSLRVIESEHSGIVTSSPEALHQTVMAHPAAHLIFLVDETDLFIAKDAEQEYAWTNVMRALSSQGKASFVLAGHQALHNAASAADHPLRNFGHVLRLGPLDLDAAKQMILDPFSALDLQFAEESRTVSWICEQTGCRPHLLARLCVAIVERCQTMGSSVISFDDVQHAAQTRKFLLDAFDRWERDKIHPLDRAILRLALLHPGARTTDLFLLLHDQGASVSEEDVEQSLTRLYAWHYALIADATGMLHCPVPLFRFWLTDLRPEQTAGRIWSSPEQRLREDLENDLAEIRAIPPTLQEDQRTSESPQRW